MTSSEKKKLIGNNAALWAASMLMSFVLPMVGESLTAGRGAFLKVLLQMMPLLGALFLSTILLSKGIGEPTEDNR